MRAKFLWGKQAYMLAISSSLIDTKRQPVYASPMQEKTCTKCGGVKPLDQFYKDSSKPSGYMSACRACRPRSMTVQTKPTYAKAPPAPPVRPDPTKDLCTQGVHHWFITANYHYTCVRCGEKDQRFPPPKVFLKSLRKFTITEDYPDITPPLPKNLTNSRPLW